MIKTLTLRRFASQVHKPVALKRKKNVSKQICFKIGSSIIVFQLRGKNEWEKPLIPFFNQDPYKIVLSG